MIALQVMGTSSTPFLGFLKKRCQVGRFFCGLNKGFLQDSDASRRLRLAQWAVMEPKGDQTVLVPPKERSLDSIPVQAKMARDHIFLRNKMGPQRIGFKKFTITD